jgi:hypothetical protein
MRKPYNVFGDTDHTSFLISISNSWIFPWIEVF